MSFSSAFLPSLVAMAEPQLPEPTSATFSGIVVWCWSAVEEGNGSGVGVSVERCTIYELRRHCLRKQ